jgi:small GTP-binding protein
VVQKKVCMVGVFATGKTSLVQQFIYSKFSEKYHSTVGVKIDRKEVLLDEGAVNLLLWDLAGHDKFQGVQGSYLRGSSGIFFVVDGTRRETLDELASLRALVRTVVGEIPAVFAINKVDLIDQWQLGQGDVTALEAQGCHVLKTSAKTGEGVEAAFMWLAGQTLKG